MNDQKPCLPGCWKDHKPGPFQGFVYHALACPNANAPKPPEAPNGEEYLRTGDGPDTLYPAKPAARRSDADADSRRSGEIR